MVDAWALVTERVEQVSTSTYYGPTWSGQQKSEPVAVVVYTLRDEWTVRIERRVLAPTGGPTLLAIEPVVGVDDDNVLGGLDSWGITQADLRSVPMRDARERLEALCATYRAAGLIASLPDEFSADWQYAKLADVVVALTGWGIRNPAAMIAKQRGAESSSTWSTRVKRARQRGMLADGPALTPKARALVAD